MKILFTILLSYLAYSSPTITLEPESDNICYGTEDYELSVKAISNSSTLNYQWMRDGKDLIAGIDSPFETDKASLKFFPANYKMSGVYSCDIWEFQESREQAITTDTAVINIVQKPSFTESNKRYVILPDIDSVLKFKVDDNFDASQDVSYQWYARSNYPDIYNKVQNLNDDGFSHIPFEGINSNELIFNFERDSINHYVLADLSYFCVVETKCSSFVSKDYNILPPRDMLKLLIQGGYGYHPPCISDYYYASILLDNYDWRSIGYTYLYDSGPFDVTWEVTENNGDYKISHDTIGIRTYFDPMQNDSFELKCNIFLEDYIDTTIFFNGVNNKYPVIKNEPKDLTSTINSSVTFTSDIYDFGSFSGVEWTKNGKQIKSDRIKINTYAFGYSSLIRSDLIIEDLNIEDEGFYSFEAINSCQNKNQSRLAKLTVTDPLSVKDSKYKLSSSPNPFFSGNRLDFVLDQASPVKIELFDLRGMLLATLEDKFLNAGEHNYRINSNDLNLYAGVYFYRIQIGNKAFNNEIIKL